MALKFTLKRASGGSVKPPSKKPLFNREEQEEAPAPKASASGSWMQKGYAGVKKQVAISAASAKGFTPEFWVEDGGEARVRILTEPVLIYSHRVMRPGRKVPDQYTCLEGTGHACPLCEAGKTYPRQWQAVYAVIDRRLNVWKDKDGKEQKKKNQVKIWRAGIKIAGLLEKHQTKHGDLRQFELDVSRSGTGQTTQYIIEVMKDESEPLNAEEKKKASEFDIIALIRPKTRSELIARIGGIGDGAEEDEDKVEV